MEREDRRYVTDRPGKALVARKVVFWQIVGFGAVVLLLWVDEILDIPAALLGAPPTPVNWRESLFESLGVLILGFLVIRLTRNIFARMRYLEGFLPVCASCKRVRVGSTWVDIEVFVRDRSEARFSHGICPSCTRTLYPDVVPEPLDGTTAIEGDTIQETLSEAPVQKD